MELHLVLGLQIGIGVGQGRNGGTKGYAEGRGSGGIETFVVRFRRQVGPRRMNLHLEGHEVRLRGLHPRHYRRSAGGEAAGGRLRAPSGAVSTADPPP